MYEFDLKFPYESQLVIGVKDWDALVGKKSSLIGKTTIDLEDRFYSQYYATCGLPKRYETEGYNKWRDVLSPTQILNKLRRQWRLKKPEYTSDNLLKITNLDERTFVFSLDHSVVIVGENDDIDQKQRHDSIAPGLVDSELKKSNTTVVTTSPGFGGQNSLFRFDSTENNDPRIIKVLCRLLSNKKQTFFNSQTFIEGETSIKSVERVGNDHRIKPSKRTRGNTVSFQPGDTGYRARKT